MQPIKQTLKLAHVGDSFPLCTAQVAINMPLKSNTRNLFNSATLNKMKKGAVLVRDFGGKPARALRFISLHCSARMLIGAHRQPCSR
jgi:hypothetical protein